MTAQRRAWLFAGRRLLLTLPVLWIVLSVVFLLIHLVPGDPIVQMLGEGATASDVSALRHSYGLRRTAQLCSMGATCAGVATLTSGSHCVCVSPCCNLSRSATRTRWHWRVPRWSSGFSWRSRQGSGRRRAAEVGRTG